LQVSVVLGSRMH